VPEGVLPPAARQLRERLRRQIDERFAALDDEMDVYMVACLVDPRFKTLSFASGTHQERAWNALKVGVPASPE
jgi:hypothetical protein